MAHKLLLKHPNLTHPVDIQGICQPLIKLGITYFAHATVDKAGKIAAISNNPEFTDYYFSNAYYNADIHMAKTDFVRSHCVWDAVDLRGRSAELYKNGFEFGLRHTFTLAQKTERGHEFFHFATDKHNPSINQFYLSQLDLLNLFIFYFKDKVAQSPILSRAYQIKFSVDSTHGSFDDNGSLVKANDQLLRESFLNDISIDKKIILEESKSLTKTDISILAWMHHGKTAHDIARLLNIAEVTVNKRLAMMKNKLGCYTQFQLGEQFSKLNFLSDDIISSMTK
jgi:DNA-binding CsgD family transcriptional regulator